MTANLHARGNVRLNALSVAQKRNGRNGWFSARPLTDGACIEADIAVEPARDPQQPLDERLGFSVMGQKGISHGVQALMLLDTTVMVNTEAVQIPGAPTFGQAYPTHPYSVSLPLEVRTNAIRQYLFALFMLIGGRDGHLRGRCGDLVARIASIGEGHLDRRFRRLLLWPLPRSRRSRHRLGFPEGRCANWPGTYHSLGRIEDRYAEVTVPWAKVVQGRIAYSRGSLNHVRLKLRTPISARQNPFRFGTPYGRWHRQLDVLRIPVVLLDVSPYTLAQVVATEPHPVLTGQAA